MTIDLQARRVLRTFTIALSVGANHLSLVGDDLSLPDVMWVVKAWLAALPSSGSPSEDAASVTSKLDQIITQLNSVAIKEQAQMATLADIVAKTEQLRASVESEGDVVASLNQWLTGENAIMQDLKAQLAAALAANDPTAMQAAVDALDSILTSNTTFRDATVAAILANTPVAPASE